MATSIINSAPTNASDVEFRDWGSKLSTAFAAVGLVKTADTGQINWSTVVKPPAISTQQGYEVWRFNDSLQATYPLFFRIAYGSGATITFPAIWITIGKGSDGSGAITGVLRTVFQIVAAPSSATTSNSYISSGDGSLLAVGMFAALSAGGSFMIERSRNAAGVPNGDGVVFVQKASSNSAQHVYQYSTGTAYSPAAFSVIVPNGSGSMSSGSSAPVFMVSAYVPNYVWQLRSLVIGNSTDLGGWGTNITVPSLGTYLVVAQPSYDGAGTTGSIPAIAWY